MFLEDKSKSAGVTAPADPFSLASLIAWLRTKDGAQEYCFLDNGHCLIAQYLKSIGVQDPCVGPHDYDVPEKLNIPLPRHWNSISVGRPRTFSAALSRALAIQGAK